MRLKIKFSANKTIIPSNNQSMVNSYIHNCLGRNNIYHDANNDYSISQLRGGVINKETKTIFVEDELYIIVSSLNSEFINKLILGILQNPTFCEGIVFKSIDQIEEKFYDGWNHFKTLTPFIIREQDKSMLSIDDTDFTEKVKLYLINKINKIYPDINLCDFDIVIPFKYPKKVKVKDVMNNAINCQISINCNKKIAELLYNIGLGKSTGSGFGTIYKTENHHLYK